jgi:hypothetical protein
MLEIFFLRWFGKKLGLMAESKGHKPGKFKVMGIGFWFLGEIVGFVIGLILVAGMNSDSAFYLAYFPALGLAAAGAFIAYSITNALPDLSAEVARENPTAP